MIRAAGIEHIGLQHGVVDAARSRCRAARKSASRISGSARSSRMPGSSSTGLIASIASFSGICSASRPPSNKPSIRAVLAMRERNVTGLIGRDGEREAAQRRLHRIEARGLGVDRQHAFLDRALHPGFQPGEIAHDFVFGAVDRKRADFLRAHGGERNRRHVAGGGVLFPPPDSGSVGSRWAAGLAAVAALCSCGGGSACPNSASHPVRSAMRRSRRLPPRGGSGWRIPSPSGTRSGFCNPAREPGDPRSACPDRHADRA